MQGRLLSLTDPNSNVTSWAYDEYGREVSLTDPLGKSVTRGHDASGQITNGG